jgi:hypothetical protein
LSEASWKQDASIPRREDEREFGLVSQEEFEPEQDRNEVAGWIASRKLGKQRKRALQVGRRGNPEPHVDPAQVARLPRPGGLDPQNRLPGEALMMDVKRND